MISGCGSRKRKVWVTEGLLVLDNDFSTAVEFQLKSTLLLCLGIYL